MIVCNSTVLIYLSKIGRLSLLRTLFKKVLVPKEVEKEVVGEGKKKNCADALEVERAISEGWIAVEAVNVLQILKNTGLHKGECEAISLAHLRKLDLLLDQTHARHAASLVGISPKGTMFVLLLALRKGLLDYDNYLVCLLSLIDSGFRMSDGVYIEAVRLGQQLR